MFIHYFLKSCIFSSYWISLYNLLGHRRNSIAISLSIRACGGGVGSGTDSWKFSSSWSIRAQVGPGIVSASDRNEYQEYFLGGEKGKGNRCVGLTTLPPSHADCLEIWEFEAYEIIRSVLGLLYSLPSLSFRQHTISRHIKNGTVY